jgi:hypothetical protein
LHLTPLSLAFLKERSLTTSPIVRHFQSQVSSCGYNICIHVLGNVGDWPKEQTIGRISRIVVWAEDVIDSVRITYEMKNGPPKTVKHGGDGGTVALDYTFSGNRHFILSVQIGSLPLNHNKPETRGRLRSQV